MSAHDLERGKHSKEAKPGFCKRCFGQIWNLDDDSELERENQELFMRRTFKELIIYLGFLVFVCFITFGMTHQDMYFYTRLMMDLFLDEEDANGVSFRSINTMSDFWAFAKGPLLSGLYWNAWYNSRPDSPNLTGYIYYENKLLGVPRIRQIRIQANSCDVTPVFSDLIHNCYSKYSVQKEEKQPFGRYKTDVNSTAWTWRSEAELNGFDYLGFIHSYEGSGFISDLYTTREPSEETITYLENNLWIDRGTRAVFISFTVYNANINLFCVITLLAEFLATGGVMTSWSFHTVKLIRYVDSLDYLIMACEVLFSFYLLYYTVEEGIEIWSTGLRHFTHFWNVLDAMLIVVSVVCLVFNVVRTQFVQSMLDEMLENPDSFANFQYLGLWETRFNNFVAIMVFIAWVKVFKYVSFNKTMIQLSNTLTRCAYDLLGFFIMFFIVFLAFTQLGYLLFCTTVKDFSTFMNSFFTLFRIILGDFDFQQLKEANRILGPLFFILFVFFVFFVLINMFLAIINDTYSEVKSDMAKQGDLYIMSDYLKMRYDKFWQKLTSTKLSKWDKDKDHISESTVLSVMSYDKFKEEMGKSGFTDEELEDFFSKYDADANRKLDRAEQQKIREELEFQKQAAEAPGTKGDEDDSDDDDVDSKNFINNDEFTILNRRVGNLEGVLSKMLRTIGEIKEQFQT